MKRTFTIAVVWLLAFVLPLHGVAAATMTLNHEPLAFVHANVGTAGDMPAAPVMQPAMHDAQGHMLQASNHASSHGSSHASSHPSSHPSNHASNHPSNPHSNHDGSKCAACTLCNMATIYSAPQFNSARPETGFMHVAFYPDFLSGPSPDRLERPPRTTFL